MRIGRKAAARVREFLTEPIQLVLGEASFEEGPGVDAGRGVALEEDLVARFAVVLAAEEVIEADLIEAGRRGVGGDVAADAEAGPVRPRHHDGRVPPDVRPDPALDVLVAREPRLALRRDRVDVVGAAQARDADLLLAGAFQQPEHHVPGAGPATGPHDGVERLEPLPGLVWIYVGKLVGQAVCDDRVTLPS